MRSLGLSFDFHDASAALVDDSVLLATSAEERFTLQKHDASYPQLAVRNTLTLAGLTAADLDVVAFYERPHEKFTRVLQNAFESYPRGGLAFARSMKKWLGTTLWTRNVIAKKLGVSPDKVQLMPHHLSHVVQAFSQSPYDAAAVLVVDGVGEWACTSLASASRDGKITVHEEYEYPQSIGLVYAAFTAFLGFKPNSGESSTMALAAFGTPRYVEQVSQVLFSNNDGTYTIRAEMLNFLGDDKQLFTGEFRKLFGEPRPVSEKYPYDSLKDEQVGVTARDQHYADIAASLQAVLTDVLLGLCRRLRLYSAEPNLCFAGGVALNCLANSELMRASGFRHFFIPADPGDGGAAVGAAALAGGFSKPTARATPYLGPVTSTESLSGLLASDYLHKLAHENRVSGVDAPESIDVLELDTTAIIQAAIDDLVAGKIVAWVQGRLESGPRALGNRSLLVDPSNLNAVRRMSRTVKSHTNFRPYALSMTAESAPEVLDCQYLSEPVLRWMQTIWPVKAALREKLRAGIHFDGTTRPQICTRDDNPMYWALLTGFRSATGLPALLNTSFNERSMPMIGDAAGAVATFLRTGVDTLAIGNTLLRKRHSGLATR